jgi:hypothetical protein
VSDLPDHNRSVEIRGSRSARSVVHGRALLKSVFTPLHHLGPRRALVVRDLLGVGAGRSGLGEMDEAQPLLQQQSEVAAEWPMPVDDSDPFPLHLDGAFLQIPVDREVEASAVRSLGPACLLRRRY